jgi:ribosomal protein S18 acetylase RimI-like enzyme
MQGELIATETDSKGSTVTIRYSQEFGGSPVVPFFLKNYAKLIEDGYAQPYMVVSNKSHKVLYAEIDNVIVGQVVFEIVEQPVRTAWITFSCVEESYRQRGIYKLLRLTHFESIVKKLGCKKIAANVHVDNTAQLKAGATVGMAPTFYRTEKDL